MLEITINEDKKCIKCGKGGATGGGLCMPCATKKIKAGGYDHILKREGSSMIDEIIEKAMADIEMELRASARKLKEAWDNNQELALSISVKAEPKKTVSGDIIVVDTLVTFVVEKIKRKNQSTFRPNQKTLGLKVAE